MTQKHYEAIARMLKEGARLANKEGHTLSPQQYGAMVKAMSKALAQDNERFDEVRFVIACAFEVKDYPLMKGWSPCNHYATDERGLCVRCGYNTQHLTMRELRKLSTGKQL